MRALLAILLAGLALSGCGSPSPETPGQDQLPRYSAPDAISMQPTGIRIPSIGLKAGGDDWQPLGIQGEDGVPVTPPGKKGQIEIPPLSQPMKLGWYCPNKLPKCGAPVPGQMGPATVLGHVNGNGKQGVFAKLAKVKVGDLVEIDRADNVTIAFKIVEVGEPLKANFPTEKVYGDTPTPTLRLITCGGGDNALETTASGSRSYKNQTIIYADMIDQRPTR